MLPDLILRQSRSWACSLPFHLQHVAVGNGGEAILTGTHVRGMMNGREGRTGGRQ